MISTHLRTLALGAALTFSSVAAQAALIVQTGNIPQTDKNLISQNCTGGANGPALSILGCLNGLPTTLVKLTAEEDIKFRGGGQAEATASDENGFTTLRIELASGAQFQSLILNIDAIEVGTVVFNDGTNTSSTFGLSKNGNNFFTITGGSFSFIEFTVTGDDNISDVKQIRIGASGLVPNPVPAPLTALLLGAGFLGLGAARSARRRAA